MKQDTASRSWPMAAADRHAAIIERHIAALTRDPNDVHVRMAETAAQEMWNHAAAISGEGPMWADLDVAQKNDLRALARIAIGAAQSEWSRG